MDGAIKAIRGHVALLWQNVSGAPPHFVFNMDEMTLVADLARAIGSF
jgi:hypothetical protein